MTRSNIISALMLVMILPLIMSACATIRGEYHGRMKCGTCHEGRASAKAPSLKNSGNPSLTCRACHNYKEDGDHHPVSMISGPIGDTADVGPEFKLVNENMECLTCHRMHREGDYRRGSRHFLVGGPYADRRDVCFRCHKKDVYREINPHESMLLKNGELNKGTCLVCHADVPDPEIDKTEDVTFRATVAFLCWRCHPLMAQDFLNKHYLQKPGRDTFIEMKWSEEDHNVKLPLDSRKRLTCSTCHNPHQPGVIKDEKTSKGAGESKRLRSQNICSHCHSVIK